MSTPRSFTCIKDVQLVRTSGGTNGGVGKGNVVSVGQTPGGARTRTEFEFALDFGGVVGVESAALRLKVTDNCAAPGSAVKFWVETITDSFKEGDYSDTCGVGASNAEVWPGQGVATLHRALYEGAPNDGDIIAVDITTLVADALAASDTTLRIRLIGSDGALSYEEDNSNRYCGFWSREKGNDGHGYKPRIETQLNVTFDPSAPEDVTPATTNYLAEGEVATRVDTSFTVRGRYVQQEAEGHAASMAASQVQFWNRYAVDDSSGNVTGTGAAKLYDTIKSSYTGAALNIAHPVVLTNIGTEARGRVRTKGSNGRWGPWTRLAAMRVIPNNRPSAPNGLSLGGTPNQPDYSGHHVDVDRGSTVSAVETQVVIESAAGTEMIMNKTSYQPGDPTTGKYTTLNGDGADTVPGGGTIWTVSHSGRALAIGERPKRRHRTVDQYGAVGEWSSWLLWVVGSSSLPTFFPPPSTKNDDLTPLVGADHSAEISGMLFEAYARNDLTSELLWQPAEFAVGTDLTSKHVAYNSDGSGADLQWGQHPYGRTRVRVRSTGSLTDWTALSPIWINALPTAPPMTIDGAAVGDDGVLRVGSLRPRVRIPFADPDLPNDEPTQQKASILSTGGVTLFSSNLTDSIEEYIDVTAAAGLVWETGYIAKGQYADSTEILGQQGVLAFTTHQPPTVVAGTLPDDNNPRTTLNWAATFFGGASQKGYRAQIDDVTDGSDRVYDSGFIEDDSATSFDVPAYILVTGHDYQAILTITDTLGISTILNGITIVEYSATADWEMNWTAALTVTADPPNDTFTRSVTDGWGIATSGSLWEILAHPEDFDVNGTQGTISLSAANVNRRARLVGPLYLNITAVVEVKTDKLAVGGTITAALAARHRDLSNSLRGELVFNSDQTVDLKIAQILSGTRSTLATYRTALTHVVGTFYWIKVAVLDLGYQTIVEARAWQAGDAELGSYQITKFISASAFFGSPGSVGLHGQSGSAITNAPVLLTFDNLSSTVP